MPASKCCHSSPKHYCVTQARYIRAWVPELAGLEPDLAHQPWQLPADEAAALGYPAPMLLPETQVALGPQRKGRRVSAGGQDRKG